MCPPPQDARAAGSGPRCAPVPAAARRGLPQGFRKTPKTPSRGEPPGVNASPTSLAKTTSGPPHGLGGAREGGAQKPCPLRPLSAPGGLGVSRCSPTRCQNPPTQAARGAQAAGGAGGPQSPPLPFGVTSGTPRAPVPLLPAALSPFWGCRGGGSQYYPVAQQRRGAGRASPLPRVNTARLPPACLWSVEPHRRVCTLRILQQNIF